MYGVDLGTTNSSICVWDRGRPQPQDILLTDEKAYESTVALIMHNGELMAGTPAVSAHARSTNKRDKYVRLFKPLLATPSWGSVRWRLLDGDPILKRDMRTDNCMIRVNDERWVLEGTTKEGTVPSATTDDVDRSTVAVLRHLKNLADARTGMPQSDGATIGVPVSFAPTGRIRLRRAAVEAGLADRIEDVHVILEPLAVAFRYGAGISQQPERVLVFDFGGGTLDLSVIDIRPHDHISKYIVRLHDDLPIGGTDIDRVLLEYLARNELKGILAGIEVDSPEWVRIMDDVKALKESLSYDVRVSTTMVVGRGEYVTCNLTRGNLTKAIGPQLLEIERKLGDMGNRLDGGLSSVDRVLMAGGSSLVCAVTDLVKRMFPGSEVDTRFAGPGKSTYGYGLARDEISRLRDMNDTEYCMWDYRNHCLESLILPDIEINPTDQARRVLVTLDCYGTELLIFSRDDSIPVPLSKIRIPAGATALAVSGHIDPLTRELSVKAYDGDSGEELTVSQEAWTGSLKTPPVVAYKGQLIRRQKGLFGSQHGIITAVYPAWGYPADVAVMERENSYVKMRTSDKAEIDIHNEEARIHGDLLRIGDVVQAEKLPQAGFEDFRWSGVDHVYEVLGEDTELVATKREKTAVSAVLEVEPLAPDRSNNSLSQETTEMSIDSIASQLELLLKSLPNDMRQSIETAVTINRLREQVRIAMLLVTDSATKSRFVDIESSLDNMALLLFQKHLT